MSDALVTLAVILFEYYEDNKIGKMKLLSELLRLNPLNLRIHRSV
jgi:hypothetical protein